MNVAASTLNTLEAAPASQPAVAMPRKPLRLSHRYAFIIWMPLLAVALGCAGAWHFVSHSFISNPGLNGVILAVSVWGASAMFGHVRSAYKEDRVFFAGLEWLRKGTWGSEPHPSLGPVAFVQGMLERLEKMGLGHQVYVQSAAMEPELEALEQYFHKKQELSNFLVGLMVGLGLLGTFIGLLETLMATGDLIGSIAQSLGGSGSGGGMESEFSRIVGGLQKPLSAMGTAFSASMFGLVGSIMLGFQAVIVNKTVANLVDNIREEVLSLAEKSQTNANVEITERYLATLMAEMLEQHRQSQERLNAVVQQITDLTPHVQQAALSSVQLAEVVGAQRESLDRTTHAVWQVRDVVPILGELAAGVATGLKESASTRSGVDDVVRHLPDQAAMNADLRHAIAAMGELARQVELCHVANRDLAIEVRHQGAVLKRLDTVLWNSEKSALGQALSGQMDVR
jgi:hypothetical protein